MDNEQIRYPAEALKSRTPIVAQSSPLLKLKQDLIRNQNVYVKLLPVLAFYLIFHYAPMYGALIAFKDFSPAEGILGSRWVGFQQFNDFFTSYYFVRTLRNTLLLSIYGLIFSFPIPILFAIVLNEIKALHFKKTVQTLSYLPHFISTVVICGMLLDFLSAKGLLNQNLGTQILFLSTPEYFRTIYISSDVWQHMGWNSIIYIAALSAADVELYDAAAVDGAGRWHRIIHIELPCILPTIVILLILRVGSIMSVGFEKVLLLYNTSTYETADIISTFVYRKGILQMNYSYSTAVGLFNSAVNFILLIGANKISKRLQETSLW